MVYVDQLFDTAKTRQWPYGQACHLFADEEQELHRFAYLYLNLPRKWFQWNSVIPHYELTPGKRWQALRHGAVELSRKEMAERIRKARKQNTGDRRQNV